MDQDLYFRDKNGKSLYGVQGYVIRDVSGDLFELATTGLRIGNSGYVPLWTQDQKLTSRSPEDIEVVSALEQMQDYIWGAIIVIAVIALASVLPH